MIATLDQVSGGRFDLGVGVGGYPHEIEACGVPVNQRGARTDETLALLARLLRGGAVEHTGRFHRIDGLTLDPLPVQRPHPPVRVGGAAGDERCARRVAVETGSAVYRQDFTPLPDRYLSSGTPTQIAARTCEYGPVSQTVPR